MKTTMLKAAAAAAFVFVSLPVAANAYCDANWAGIGLSAAPSPSGHMVAVRGNDGMIKVNEWINSTSSWRGWTVLPGNQSGIVSEPWVSLPMGNYQNIFARTNDSIIQWVGTWNGAWSYQRVAFGNDGNYFTGHIASASTSSNSQYPPVYFFATATNGTLMSKLWDGHNMGTWTNMGVPGSVVGSPYAEQVDATTFNVFVRLSDGSIQQKVYTNGSPSPWYAVPDNGMGDPAVVHTNYPYFYTTSHSGAVQSFYWNGYGFTGNQDMSFAGSQNLSPVKVSANTAYLYGRDYSGNIWRATRVNSLALTAVKMVNCP